MKPKISLLVVDVDNTLFDWFEVWHRSFSAMLEKIAEVSGVPEEDLYPEIRKIHRAAGTSEYSLLIGEMPTLKKLYGQASVEIMKDAIEAFRIARRRALHLYPTVYETLIGAKKAGVTISAYTESQAFYTSYRFRKLGLDKIVDFLFSPPDHEFPEGITRSSLRAKPATEYEFFHTKHFYTPVGELKPNPRLLLDVIAFSNSFPEEAVYVGDSLFKDVAMAQDAGVTDVYAAYGASHKKKEYELLRKVTHWTDEDVEREKKTSDRHVIPTYTLDKNFAQICNLVDWKSKNGR